MDTSWIRVKMKTTEIQARLCSGTRLLLYSFFVYPIICPKIPKSIELVNRLIFLFPLTRPPPIGLVLPTAPFHLTQKLESLKVSINLDVASPKKNLTL